MHTVLSIYNARQNALLLDPPLSHPGSQSGYSSICAGSKGMQSVIYLSSTNPHIKQHIHTIYKACNYNSIRQKANPSPHNSNPPPTSPKETNPPPTRHPNPNPQTAKPPPAQTGISESPAVPTRIWAITSIMSTPSLSLNRSLRVQRNRSRLRVRRLLLF